MNRKTSAERRRSLSESLRQAARDGVLAVGAMLPTVRELSLKHQLSSFAVSRELQILIDEGVLYTTPRVGTFVGKSMEHISLCFLLVTSARPFVPFIAMGFEERIAQLGACSLVLSVEEALDSLAAGTLPNRSGVFDFATNDKGSIGWTADQTVPLVRFADGITRDPGDPHGIADRIYFDEEGGGRQATEYLLRLGHTRVAYIGLHTVPDSAYYQWSLQRMQGWRDTMVRSGFSVDNLLFLPDVEPETGNDEVACAASTAQTLLKRKDITAIVGANDHAILGLIKALRQADIAEHSWPVMVGFDSHASVRRHVLTSLRLPWEEVGRRAAEFLWERSTGKMTGPPQFVSIPMRVIPRPSANRHVSADRSNSRLVPAE